MQKKLFIRVMCCVGQWARRRVHLRQVVEPLLLLEEKTFDQWEKTLFDEYRCPCRNQATYMDTLPGTTNESMPNTDDGDGDSEATLK